MQETGTESKNFEPAERTRYHRTHLVWLACLLFLVDRLVKNWIQSRLGVSESIPIIPDVFNITLVYNTGAAFSLFRQYPELLLVITFVLLTGLSLYSFARSTFDRMELIGFGLVLGGALGNLADRLLYGKVVDYLDFALIQYPIFNLADVCIFCGVCLLLLHYVIRPSPAK